MAALVICKNNEDQIKNRGTSMEHHSCLMIPKFVVLAQHFISTCLMLKGSYLCSWWWYDEICLQIMVVLLTYMNKEDPFKHEGARMVIPFNPLYVYIKQFTDAHGQPAIYPAGVGSD